MDRHSSGLDRLEMAAAGSGLEGFLVADERDMMFERSIARLTVPARLFELAELDMLYDEVEGAVWTYMRPAVRPMFSPTMLGDFECYQNLLATHFGPSKVPVRYWVLGSRTPGIWSLGGDLALFDRLIRSGDKAALAEYGYRCVGILNKIMRAHDLPMLTIGLVSGQALGGGFEALLAFDFIIAERGSSFGLPEVKFSLFPGMGAHSILTRKIGAAAADRMIQSGETYSAEAMFDMGIVTHLAEPGEGEAAVREFIAKSNRRHAGLFHARRAARIASPVPLEEMRAIVDEWAEAALQLREQDLKLMLRLANAQSKLPKVATAA
jgi:DSF synthase